MAARRSPLRKSPSSPTYRYGSLTRRNNGHRLSPRSRKQVVLKASLDSHESCQVASNPATRPVLVPLHNLRRLPSRIMALSRGRKVSASEHQDVQVGGKRKRVASTNENSYTNPRPTRSIGRFKRRRSVKDDSSEDDFLAPNGAMEVDETQENESNWMSDGSQMGEHDLDDSDDFLLNEARPSQLNRLRKDHLMRLYDLAGCSGLPEDSTKGEYVDAIIASRSIDDLPPSSPPTRTDHSSGCSSDDGNEGGGEETDFTQIKNALRRRVTVQEIGRSIDRPKTRTFSVGLSASSGSGSKKVARIAKNVKSPTNHYGSLKRRALSSQSSPTTSSATATIPSPPATRLRSRTISADSSGLSASTSSFYASSSSAASSKASKSRGSSISAGPSKKSGKGKRVDFETSNDELHQDEDEDAEVHNVFVSPRRLRSKDRQSNSSSCSLESTSDVETSSKRVTPMRKAKGKIGCLKEDSTADEDEDEEGEGDAAVNSSSDEDSEIDQLDSSPTPSIELRQMARPRDQRTPLKKRLRSRKVLDLAPPSDGDDEEEDEDDEDTEVQSLSDGTIGGDDDSETETGDVDDAPEQADDEELGSQDSDDDEETLVEPRKLRNGKIVGDEQQLEEDEEEEEDAVEASVIDVDEDELEEVQEVDEDETMEDEFDLDTATNKSLVRLRRDDLVRLCETRDLDVDGTKPQLAKALLEWRDRQSIASSATSSASLSAPSSTSTARPPSTKVPGRTRKSRSKSKSNSPPVLMRTSRVHEDEPITPPVSKEKKDAEGELELDLESLGLEDREIPPEKLTKLEKIGSGGFKDVFIGKFKGRKVAIAEFRDQLSAMDIKELKLLAEFAHPNIVRFLGVSIPENTKETPVMIVSELCANGDLFDYVRNVSPPSLYKVLNMMLDIARGLQYLHERKPSVIHRDCKSSNILITSKGVAKIADFGLAKVKQSTRSMVRSLVGTVNWQAPELWHPHPKYNHKVDVFSCACVYWEMLQWHNPNKKYPWEGMNEHAIYEAVGSKHQSRPTLSGLRKLWCPEIVDLTEKMWAQDANDRPDISEIVNELQSIIKKYR
ncbi:hypothetical protein SCHPADRAFT_878163 [Schizopora paradoxa]|uniref:Protein kinase domain-containing protein n=1 Tax=Schizopora paradoxa TaxID=27342 RepID=A0A0H2RF11_9AGAM|nr:hypothetical protein SCHPADRAFT_878163 [Schizopora paradoxa]